MIKPIIFLLFILSSNAFFPRVNKKNTIPEKKMDIFDKFEKYSREQNHEKQQEYLNKIHKIVRLQIKMRKFIQKKVDEG
tara:strand:- start:272 stop:508 length:237 start_codon:yes stop_codon:yes gene_type:complete